MHLSKSTICTVSILMTLSPYALAAAFYVPPTANSTSLALTSRDWMTDRMHIKCDGNVHKCRNGALDELMALADSNPDVCQAAWDGKLFCHINHCVFTENVQMFVHAYAAYNSMRQIKDHGCAGCGSIDWIRGNADKTIGRLVVNYVEDVKECDKNGVCNTGYCL